MNQEIKFAVKFGKLHEYYGQDQPLREFVPHCGDNDIEDFLKSNNSDIPYFLRGIGSIYSLRHFRSNHRDTIESLGYGKWHDEYVKACNECFMIQA